jgi:hypothetical protein
VGVAIRIRVGTRSIIWQPAAECADQGIDAEAVQGLVLGWLRELAVSGERFRALEALGRERLGREIASLRQTAGHLAAEGASIRDQVEARVEELTRTRAETLRASLEKSIVKRKHVLRISGPDSGGDGKRGK